nr:Ig-like domain-containing protein [uncultured Arsenicibacter sp.]
MEQRRLLHPEVGKRLLWALALVILCLSSSYAQGIRYSVKLLSDGITYQVSLSSTVSLSGSDQQTNSGQITIVAPAGSLTIANLTNVGSSTWANNTTVRAPSQNSSKDYFIFGLTSFGKSIPYAAGVEIPLFTFQNTGSCAGAIEVWASSDPFQPNPPSQPINVGNDLTALGFLRLGVSNAWLGNYGVGTANCSLLPVVAFSIPTPNSLTSLTPTVTGTVTAGSSVTVLATGGQSCIATVTGTGWTCSSLTLPAGPNTLTALSPNSIGPGNTATVSFTAVALPAIAITSPAASAQTSQTPTVTGTATPNTSITVTAPGGSSCVVVSDGSGNWSCSSLTLPVGPVTITATAGNISGRTSATVAITTIAPPTISIVTPAANATISNSPTVSGLATAGASVTLLGPNSQSCTTTADGGGNWSCSSFSLPAGPVTLTAIANNTGGTTSTTASYTVLTTISACGQSLNLLSSFTATALRTVDPTSVQVVTQPASGHVYVNSDGTVRYQPAGSAAGSASFTLRAAQLSSGEKRTNSGLSAVQSGGCILCSVSSLNSVTTTSTTDFATIDQTLSVGGTTTIRAKLSGTAPKGDRAGFVIANPALLSAAILPTITVRTYLAGTLKETYTLPAIASIQILSDAKLEVSFVTQLSDFDEVYISYRTTVGALASLDVYYGFGRPEPIYQTISFNIAYNANLCTDVLSQTTCPQAFSVLTNDIVSGSGIVDPTSVSIVSQPTNGSAIANADGTVNFRPTDPAAGSGSFVYQVCTKVDPAATANNSTNGVTASGISSAVCVGCSVTSATAVGDASLSNFATISIPVGAGGYAFIRTKLARMAPAGDIAGFLVENTSLVSAELLSSVTINTYKGGFLQETAISSGLLSLSGLGGGQYELKFQTTKEFDEIEIRTAPVVGVLSTTKVYYGFAKFGRTCTQYNATVSFPAGMAYQCPGDFTFGNCATATTSGTFVVGYPSSGTLTLPLTVNLLGTVTVNVSGSGVTGSSTQTIVSGQTSYTLPFAYDGSAPRFTRTISVTSAQATGSCSTTINVYVMPTVAINSPAANAQTNLTPTVSGTVTTLASLTIYGPGGQTCTPTVNGSGGWSCNSFAFTAGPVTLTAVTVNEVGSQTVTATFTAVAPPTIAILVPAPNSLTSLTPVVSGTTTIGAAVTLLAPGGQVCNPTVDGGGNWSCSSLTLSGQVTLTAIAQNVGGTATTTTTFTAIAAPTLAITTPGPNSLTSTTPLVSGTVTAGSTVTVLATGGQTCVATVTGTTWSCNGITIPAGANTLTVVAANAGGSTTATTSFTAVAVPSIAIDVPASNTTTYLTQVVSGTATPNTSVTVLAAANAACVVTVSGAGNWTCTSLTLTPGPQTVTAIVTNVGGTASATVSFTALNPPCSTPAALSLTPSSVTLNIGDATVITAMGGSPGVLAWNISPVAGITPATSGAGTSTGSLTFATAGVYTLTYTATNSTLPPSCTTAQSVSATVSIVVTDPQAVLSPKVILGGAYSAVAGLMRDNLRSASLLPLVEPYSSSALAGTGFTHVGGGGETTTSTVLSVTGNNAIVDWVFVELRSPSSNTTVIATKSALVQRDGDVVDVDGVSPLRFNVGAGSYYVVIRHRNHLGVMTAATVPLTSTATTVDFTNPATITYGTDAQQSIGGVRALWPGNTNGVDNVSGTTKRRIIYQGGDNDLGVVFGQVFLDSGNQTFVPTYIVQKYLTSDVNLDGLLKYQGAENDLQIIFATVLLHPGNVNHPTNPFVVSYIVEEQVP